MLHKQGKQQAQEILRKDKMLTEGQEHRFTLTQGVTFHQGKLKPFYNKKAS
ncbi:hypothetical protein [Iodobacter fluviatilis]|jgi:hypothetical protein|uniref:hypothetical protein n=1 Tax=Iodobacter fluviatilis TaxID=537 RepID=UPI00165D8ED4|nr:hypothetical protein [Iodobacter fluviatilis]